MERPGVERKVPKANVGMHLECAMHQEHAVHLGWIECGSQPFQRRLGSVHPERVTVYHEERGSAENIEGRLHATAGFQQGDLTAQDGPWVLACSETRRNLIRMPMGIHDDGLHTCFCEAIECVIDERAASEGQQWLGGGVR